MVKVKGEAEIQNMVKTHPLELRRIFSITAHIDHGKSTAADFLMRRAGLLSDTLAGERRLTDYDEEEQMRGITIFTSVVLLNYDFEGQSYLLEINDTPGHISFTGEVSRALRGSDGAVLLVDALEGVMTQTETNIRLAVGDEWCKPVLFINKVDRLIRELKLPPQEVIERFDSIIKEVNRVIKEVAPERFKDEWALNATTGKVVFGSAKDGWAFTIPMLKRKGISASIVIERYQEAIDKNTEEPILWLRENLPLDEAMLEVVIEHLPSPKEAQKYRMEHLWRGDISKGENISSIDEVKEDIEAWSAYSLIHVDPNGPLIGLLTKIFIHPKTKRPTLIGRVLSGTLRQGDEIYLSNARRTARLRRLGIMEIDSLLAVDEIPAGNLFAVELPDIVPSGETFFSLDYKDIPGFEKIIYASDAVVSRSIKPEDPKDLAKLGDVVGKWVMADPTASFRKDEKSGEYILSGIDPLQIDILTKRVQEEVPIKIGIPITVYMERVRRQGVNIKTKCTEGHNKLELYVEPLDDKTIKLIREERIDEYQDKKERAKLLREEAGWDTKEARNIWAIQGPNILVNKTVGVQRLDRIKAYVISTFRDFTFEGGLAKEPVLGLKVVVTDAIVHEDPAHTRAGQIFVMTFSALNVSFLSADPALYEPILRMDVKVPEEYMGSIISILSQHRGKIIDTQTSRGTAYVHGEIPASESVTGIDEVIRSSTQGRAFFGYQFVRYEMLPRDMQYPTIKKILERKHSEGKEIREEIATPFTFKARFYPDFGAWRNGILQHMEQDYNKLAVKELVDQMRSTD